MTSRPGHLIHIGYPKAGSSFLQEWFASHPQLAYSGSGFAGYADTWDLVRQAVREPEAIAYRVTSREDFAAPIPNAGADAFRGGDWAVPAGGPEAVCAELAGLFPAARILLVTRGFRSAYLSGFSQYVRMGGDRDFDPTGRDMPRGVFDTAWDYDGLIRMYEAAFDGRVTVLPYELLRDDPGRFVAELQAALGLDAPGPVPGRVNPSLAPAELRWYPRLTRAVEALPVRGALRARILRVWIRAVGRNRFAGPIQLLDRVRREPPIDPEQISDALLESFRGRAEALRGRALYAPYAAEYLL